MEMPWDEFREGEEWDYFMAFLQRMQDSYEEAVLDQASQVLNAMPEADTFPAPNTAHPSLVSHADFVRRHNRHSVKVVKPGMHRAYLMADQAECPSEPLSRSYFVMAAKRHWGPMPFLGDPLHEVLFYEWEVWFDDYGRHIAGESTIMYRKLV